MHKKKWLVFFTEMMLLAFLSYFIWLLLDFGFATQTIDTVGLQRARVERMTTDILLIQYQPSSASFSLSVAELQDTLPRWIATQKAMAVGDAAQGLPRYPPGDIVDIVHQMDFDYVPMEVSLQKIAANPTRIDPLQVKIVLDHGRAYVQAINLILTAWDNHIQDGFFHLFVIKMVLMLLLFTVITIDFYVRFSHCHKKKEKYLQEM